MTRNFTIVLISLFSPIVAHSQVLTSPTKLSGKFDSEKQLIRLNWEMKDSTIAGFNLFVKKGSEEYFLLWGKAGLISETAYDFEVIDRLGEFYEFKVGAIVNFPNVVRSDYSNSITVEVPSTFLPMVKLNQSSKKKKVSGITWDYKNSPPDLIGFILFLDNKEILLPASSRSYSLAGLPSGHYMVEISAITDTGLRSDPSPRKIIRIK